MIGSYNKFNLILTKFTSRSKINRIKNVLSTEERTDRNANSICHKYHQRPCN